MLSDLQGRGGARKHIYDVLWEVASVAQANAALLLDEEFRPEEYEMNFHPY